MLARCVSMKRANATLGACNLNLPAGRILYGATEKQRLGGLPGTKQFFVSRQLGLASNGMAARQLTTVKGVSASGWVWSEWVV